MNMKKNRLLAITAFMAICVVCLPARADLDNFREAKALMKTHVYLDQTESDEGTFYCGCDWRWKGRSGGRTELDTCQYTPRKQEKRAARTEWEHVVPAWVMGHQRQCWQEGGRSNCRKDDQIFKMMEADPHNLVVSIGEVNGDRSNFSFGMLEGEPRRYGACDVEIDFKQRVIEPRPEVRGQIARIYFYVFDRYNLRMSRKQERLLMAWNAQHPVTGWERLRDERISRIAGHHNPFITGERTWGDGKKTSEQPEVTSYLDSSGEGTMKGAAKVLWEIGEKLGDMYVK